MIDEGMTDVHLLYTTNGTVQNWRIHNLLAQFKNVSLVFSIEGTGTPHSYIRGGKYPIEQIESNMARYNELDNVKINFNVTIQNYNLLNLEELYNLLHKWEAKYQRVDANSAFTTICNQPNYLSPLNVPDNMRDTALEQLADIDDFKTLRRSLTKRRI